MSRISLACVQCRSRHIRCDGSNPCIRCTDHGIECTFQKSKRGGRPRKVAPVPSSQLRSDSTSTTSFRSPGSSLASSSIPNPASAGGSPLFDVQQDEQQRHVTERERLLDLYYTHFHAAHPSSLPRSYYRRHFLQNTCQMAFLDAVMQFVGSLFDSNLDSSKYEASVAAYMPNMDSVWSPYDVQAMTHLTTAVFWLDEAEKAQQLFQNAITQALRLGMHSREFAEQHSFGDPVLAESWRRTYYLLYEIDCHITAITFASSMRTSIKQVNPTVQLPCEEREYESGSIPRPRSLEEYDNREFDSEDRAFSSFAEMIGLLRIFDHHILGKQRNSSADSLALCLNADSSTRSWYSLLPRAKREMITSDGVLDEYIYRATMMIPVYTVDTHRVLSNLAFDPIERISTCSPAPPPACLPALYRQEAPSHTAKILQAANSLTELLTLPTRISVHTPFSICMVSSVTIAHLSACKNVFQGEQLQIARDRIRVAMGTLKAFGEVWPRGKRTHSEVQIIARELLGISLNSDKTATPPAIEPGWSASAGFQTASLDFSALDTGALFDTLLFSNSASFDMVPEFSVSESGSYQGLRTAESSLS